MTTSKQDPTTTADGLAGRGPSSKASVLASPADEIAVPQQWAEWAFEYKTGWRDGRDKEDFAWSPNLGNTARLIRREAYTAGRKAGRKVRKANTNAGETAK